MRLSISDRARAFLVDWFGYLRLARCNSRAVVVGTILPMVHVSTKRSQKIRVNKIGRDFGNSDMAGLAGLQV